MNMNQRPLDKLEGLHLATNQPVEIVLTPTESRLAQGKTNEEWDALCVSIEMRTGHVIQGQIQIDYLTVNGNRRVCGDGVGDVTA